MSILPESSSWGAKVRSTDIKSLGHMVGQSVVGASMESTTMGGGRSGVGVSSLKKSNNNVKTKKRWQHKSNKNGKNLYFFPLVLILPMSVEQVVWRRVKKMKNKTKEY